MKISLANFAGETAHTAVLLKSGIFFTLHWNIISYNEFYLAIDLSRWIKYIYLVTLLVESEVMKHKA